MSLTLEQNQNSLHIRSALAGEVANFGLYSATMSAAAVGIFGKEFAIPSLTLGASVGSLKLINKIMEKAIYKGVQNYCPKLGNGMKVTLAQSAILVGNLLGAYGLASFLLPRYQIVQLFLDNPGLVVVSAVVLKGPEIILSTVPRVLSDFIKVSFFKKMNEEAGQLIEKKANDCSFGLDPIFKSVFGIRTLVNKIFNSANSSNA